MNNIYADLINERHGHRMVRNPESPDAASRPLYLVLNDALNYERDALIAEIRGLVAAIDPAARARIIRALEDRKAA